jgi:DNA-binding transcriptional regulator YhcF (GntR family)
LPWTTRIRRIYLRIAADIRGRIEADELKPGQPAPSITTLTQEWSVAGRPPRTLSRCSKLKGWSALPWPRVLRH